MQAISQNTQVTISSQYQITIPSYLRKKYSLKPGTKLVLGDDDRGIYMFTRPSDFREFIMSIPKGKFRSKKEIDDYISSERKSWNK